MSWAVIEFPIPDEIGEIAAERLRLAGADGVAEEWRRGQSYIRGFWQDASEIEARAAAERVLQALIDESLLRDAPSLTFTEMEDQDWLEGWKQYFTPLDISERLAIVPSWEHFTAKPGQAVITLDPGMAFGTGTHGTTFTCLQAMSEYCLPDMRVCDVGTGSGILAIAAVKLGAASVTATDNDSLAVRVARENADRNEVGESIDFSVADLLAGVEGSFDLVIANILAPVITLLIPDLVRVLLPHGFFISSGYITDQEADIRSALEAHHHRILARYSREGWVTLVSCRADLS